MIYKKIANNNHRVTWIWIKKKVEKKNQTILKFLSSFCNLQLKKIIKLRDLEGAFNKQNRSGEIKKTKI